MTSAHRFDIALPVGHPILRLHHEVSDLRQRLSISGGEV